MCHADIDFDEGGLMAEFCSQSVVGSIADLAGRAGDGGEENHSAARLCSKEEGVEFSLFGDVVDDALLRV